MSIGYINDTTDEGPAPFDPDVEVHEGEEEGRVLFADATNSKLIVNHAWISAETTIDLSEVR